MNVKAVVDRLKETRRSSWSVTRRSSSLSTGASCRRGPKKATGSRQMSRTMSSLRPSLTREETATRRQGSPTSSRRSAAATNSSSHSSGIGSRLTKTAAAVSRSGFTELRGCTILMVGAAKKF